MIVDEVNGIKKNACHISSSKTRFCTCFYLMNDIRQYKWPDRYPVLFTPLSHSKKKKKRNYSVTIVDDLTIQVDHYNWQTKHQAESKIALKKKRKLDHILFWYNEIFMQVKNRSLKRVVVFFFCFSLSVFFFEYKNFHTIHMNFICSLISIFECISFVRLKFVFNDMNRCRMR